MQTKTHLQNVECSITWKQWLGPNKATWRGPRLNFVAPTSRTACTFCKPNCWCHPSPLVSTFLFKPCPPRLLCSPASAPFWLSLPHQCLSSTFRIATHLWEPGSTLVTNVFPITLHTGAGRPDSNSNSTRTIKQENASKKLFRDYSGKKCRVGNEASCTFLSGGKAKGRKMSQSVKWLAHKNVPGIV